MAAVALTALVFVSTPDAVAQTDPGKASALYSQCQDFMKASKPCQALKTCEEALKALNVANIQRLTDEARTSCVKSTKAKRRAKRKAQPCPDGMTRPNPNSATCCWSGQYVEEGYCMGTPASCPEGRQLNTLQTTCVNIPCDNGKERVDGGHCCWPDQVYIADQNRCIGVPKCPTGQEANGEECVVAIPDQDNDGIADNDDLCPTVAEDRDRFEDADGCPEFDNDQDGLCDAHFTLRDELSNPLVSLDCEGADGCISDPEDKDGYQDADGCPDPDNDRDEIADVDDQCPDEYGVREFEGCLPPRDYTYLIVGWTGVGAGVALLATGGGLLASAANDRNTLNSPELSIDNSSVVVSITEVEAQQLRDDINTKETWAAVTFSTGGAFLATGVVFLILDALREEPAPPTPGQDMQLSVAPLPEGGGVFSLGGRF